MVMKEHQELSILTKETFCLWFSKACGLHCKCAGPQATHPHSGASHDFPELEVWEGLGVGLAGLAEAGLCSLRGIYMESSYVLSLAGTAEHKMEAEPWGARGCREARKELGKSRREVSSNLGLRCFSTCKAGVGACTAAVVSFPRWAQGRG